MSWQLIYTSAPRGLLSGQSGFCTVARSADLRAALVQRLEQISSYHYLRVSEVATANRNPTVSAFRLLDLRGAKYYVLTRIQPCGLDFTARTNHLAHHLVFQPDELAALPSPAAILRHWPGWLRSWQGEPRVLEEIGAASFANAAKSFLPAQTWARMTGDGGRAAGLLESECVRGCYLVCPPGSEEQALEMYCETLQLLNFNGQFPLRPWRHTFTAFLQAEDNPNDFQWRGCQENTPAYKQALTRSAPLIPLAAVRVPANSLVKLAREQPKPPPSAPPASPSGPAPTSSQALRLERSARTSSVRTPALEYVNAKKPARAQRPALLDLNFSIHSATLARVGIFAFVLVVLLLFKYHVAHRPAEQGNPASAPEPKPAPTIAPPPKASAIVAAPDAKQLERLVGAGPTYVLAVPNLTDFNLPIGSISRFQNLLQRYDKLEPGTLPGDLRLEVDTDRWDFPPGEALKVAGRDNPKFSAAGPGFRCVFDYSDALGPSKSPLAVKALFDKVPGAFSIHFGFSSTNGGDPFRLLIVNENNPPAPLLFGQGFVRNDRQELGAALTDSMRECLFTNFQLLAGWRWQLQPFLKPKGRSPQYLYLDWPAADRPAFGCELDFANIRKRLEAQRQDFKKRLESLRQPLGLPLGKWLEFTNASLQSFLAFSPEGLSAGKFLEYLDKLRKFAPDKAWIKEWHNHFDSDEREEVAAKLQDLYGLWNENRSQDERMLTVTNAGGPTNYFFDSWQRLKDAESVHDLLDKVQKRLVELDNVAYIGLCIVDPRQPGLGLEMIRFEGP